MVLYIRKSIHLNACIKTRKIAAKIACVNEPLVSLAATRRFVVVDTKLKKLDG